MSAIGFGLLAISAVVADSPVDFPSSNFEAFKIELSVAHRLSPGTNSRRSQLLVWTE